MKAVVITSYGGVEGIDVQEVDIPPAPTADRVRVRVHAAGLNRADILQRRGHYPAPPGYPANIPGLEFAGEVESIGQEVRTWKIGDRVFGITGGGAQAEFVVVPASNLARIPAELDWVQAGAMPEVLSPHTMRSLRGPTSTWASAFSFTQLRPELAQPQSKWLTPPARLFMALHAQRTSSSGSMN